jgi:putative salt-induced outer membrane protein YdiY
MKFTRRAPFAALALSVLFLAKSAAAQTPAAAPPPPPPLWDVQVGASFVGTTGNSDTASTGADFAAHRRGPVWQIESAATIVRTNDDDVTTAERYLGMLRGQRKLTSILGLSSGIKLERDRFAGLDLRSILDGGLSWALVHHPEWSLDGVTSIAWLHESHTEGDGIDDPIGVLQLLSRIPFGAAGDTTQRFTLFPDLSDSARSRSEAEVTAQAAMNAHLALKMGYLLRHAHQAVVGFKKDDSTMTASIVLRWKASTPAAR